ncbi:MAG: hypothetical protein PHI27_01205 [Eubacteriales bacterium]|nr:hypothetical protein [Eubacteriales bacterium]MDD3880852.1 hypothetical protein [Eubacteriales bacterium]MDD4511781.1 hypothetical protein [Eubacteriales bacterium]
MNKKLHWGISALITLVVFIGLLFGVTAIVNLMSNNLFNSMSQELKDTINSYAGTTMDGTAIAPTATPEATLSAPDASGAEPAAAEATSAPAVSQAPADGVITSGLGLSPALEAEYQSVAGSLATILTVALALYAVVLVLVTLLWCFLSARHYSRLSAWKVGSNIALVVFALYSFMNMLALLAALVGDSSEFRSIIAVVSAISVGICCFIIYKFSRHFEDDKPDLRGINAKLGR